MSEGNLHTQLAITANKQQTTVLAVAITANKQQTTVLAVVYV